ncbi:MAG: DUF5050 domain-containing protein [Clostridiales bacterium]|nr:DUF5050 domain-containing protein [Clostridiales bacterium]
MSSAKKNIIIICSAAAVLIILITISLFVGKIPMNDESTTGNTAGNLNNSGLFCETDDKVYFANAYDNYSLYSMNPDESEIEKIGVNQVSSINAGGDYLYYYMQSGTSGGKGLGYMGRTAGIYRSKKDGSQVKCLERTYADIMQLCGNYLYYQAYNNKNGLKLNKVKIDKSEMTTIVDYFINPASYANGRIYYHGTQEDHYLYTLDTATDRVTTLWQGNVWNPVYSDGYIYFMDLSNNYGLSRYSIYDNVVEILTNDRVDYFNVYDYYIYYQTSAASNPALKRMYVDGSYLETVAEGIYENINITSQYVYFNEYDKPTPVYKTSTFGVANVTTFDAAANAALENASN